MRKLSRGVVFSIALAASAAVCSATVPGIRPLPPGGVYRYVNPQGNTVLTHMLPDEGVRAGYEIIDSQGRVLHREPPALTGEEAQAQRAAREQALREAEQARRDAELLRMYAAPEDAERARDRQISALQLNIDYARGNISQTRARLEQEISNAARIERSGRPVPENTNLVIERYTRQISDLEQDIAQYERDIEQVHISFEAIIERLRVIVR